jgi:hypothetical protein
MIEAVGEGISKKLCVLSMLVFAWAETGNFKNAFHDSLSLCHTRFPKLHSLFWQSIYGANSRYFLYPGTSSCFVSCGSFMSNKNENG